MHLDHLISTGVAIHEAHNARKPEPIARIVAGIKGIRRRLVLHSKDKALLLAIADLRAGRRIGVCCGSVTEANIFASCSIF